MSALYTNADAVAGRLIIRDVDPSALAPYLRPSSPDTSEGAFPFDVVYDGEPIVAVEVTNLDEVVVVGEDGGVARKQRFNGDVILNGDQLQGFLKQGMAFVRVIPRATAEEKAALNAVKIDTRELSPAEIAEALRPYAATIAAIDAENSEMVNYRFKE